CAALSAARSPRDSGIAEAAPSRPSSASHAILAAAATAAASSWPPGPTGQRGSSRESDSTSGLGGLQRNPRQHGYPAVPEGGPPCCWTSKAPTCIHGAACIIEQMLRPSIFRGRTHESQFIPAAAAAEVAMAASVAGAAGRHRLQTRCKVQDAKKTLFLQANWMDYTYFGEKKELTGSLPERHQERHRTGQDRRSPPSWLTASSGRSCCWPRDRVREFKEMLQGHAQRARRGAENLQRGRRLRTKNFMSPGIQ
uniref:BRCT domain-containing protein n=1 Tax=Macrostomum lignano TaxID=282301 RepID=A0A1I8FBG0_9PLAT